MENLDTYNRVRAGATGYHIQPRGLLAVSGKEAVQFLDGMITNDVKTLEDGAQMAAAFPNAQGRLLAVVSVLRQGDGFLIETEEATHGALFQSLHRFTYAGDFFVEDLSEQYRWFDLFGPEPVMPEGSISFSASRQRGVFVSSADPDTFADALAESGAVEVDDRAAETLRIERGVPRYGIDMDETTVVPELGITELISYNKGCYIGQEIIARIHFRGHVAKQLTGLLLDVDDLPAEPLELTSPAGKPAGRMTSVTYSPALGSHIALAYVRYEFLGDGTALLAGGKAARVQQLPFVAV